MSYELLISFRGVQRSSITFFLKHWEKPDVDTFSILENYALGSEVIGRETN